MLVPVRRWQWRWPSLVVTILLLAIYLLYSPGQQPWPAVGSGSRHAAALLKRQQQFWRLLHADIVGGAPKCPPVGRSEIGDLSIDYTQSGTTPDRPDRLIVSTTQLQDLRSKHQAFTLIL